MKRCFNGIFSLLQSWIAAGLPNASSSVGPFLLLLLLLLKGWCLDALRVARGCTTRVRL